MLASKKITIFRSAFIILIFTLSLLTSNKSTAESDLLLSGFWGSSSWEYYNDGTVIIKEGVIGDGNKSPWYLNTIPKTDIKKIKISENVATGTNASELFYDLKNLEKIENLENLDTSRATIMNSMFQYTPKLKNINISNFKTENVTKMEWMFSGCGVEELDVSSFNTKNVTSMYNMFSNMKLDTLDLSTFDTTNLKAIDAIFGRSEIKKVDISAFYNDTLRLSMSELGGYAKIYEFVIGDNFKWAGSVNLPKGEYPYSDKWEGITTKKQYPTTENFIKPFQLVEADTYFRVYENFSVFYYTGSKLLLKEDTSVMDTYKIKDGSEFNIPNEKIIGWNTKEDGTGKDYPFDRVVSVTEETYNIPIILFAQFKDKISVNGSISWNDDDNQEGKRPESIEVELYKTVDGVTTKIDEKVISEESEWKYSFGNLYEDEDGKNVTYSVEGQDILNYTCERKGHDLVYNYIPEKIEIEVVKTWNDENNQAKKRPNSIEVELYADEVLIDTQTLSEANGWKYKWINLDRRSGGKELDYSIKEKKVPIGYSASYEIDEKNNIVSITNSYELIKETNPVVDSNNGNLPKAGIVTPLLINIFGLGLIGVGVIKFKNR